MRFLAAAVPLFLLAVAPFCWSLDDWDKYDLVWQDEFDFLDLNNKWQHEVTATGGGNGEFQLYTPSSENSFVRDGRLYIRPIPLADSTIPQTGQKFGHDYMYWGTLNVWDIYGSCTNADNGGCYRTGYNVGTGDIPPATSARLRTFQKFSFRFGRAVIRAKISVGDWLWPAIWMMPESSVYGGWPRSGEIDIMESIGNRDLVQNGQPIGIQKMGSAMHWGPSWDDNRFWLTNLHKTDNNNYGDNFHTYILDWSPNGIRFFVDDENQALMDVPYPLINANPWWINFWEWGKPWRTNENPWGGGSNLAPFDQAFHFIVNVAVGGTNGFIPDGAVNRGGAGNLQKPWNNGDGYHSAMRKFYDNRDNWKWTWDQEGDNNAMQIDYIRVYSL